MKGSKKVECIKIVKEGSETTIKLVRVFVCKPCAKAKRRKKATGKAE